MKHDEAKKKVIGVLMGGLSKEREISLRSGKAVSDALRKIGCEHVADIDVSFDLAVKLKEMKVEIAFVALHGRYGEDGAVQGLLEFLRIPYTGSGILGSALSLNKVFSKKIFAKEGITTPEFAAFKREQSLKEISQSIFKKRLGFPLVIKPSCEGSTIGLSVVEDEGSLEDAISVGFKHDSEIIVEKFIHGVEVTVGILNDKALSLVEIAPKEGIFDFKAKYTKGLTDYFCPARVPEKVSLKAQDLGRRAFDALGCHSFGRVDMIVDGNGNPNVLEVNSIPGMTGTSLLPMAAKEIGLGFGDLVEKILLDASLKIGV